MDGKLFEELMQTVDELALKAVMLEPTDVGGMGELLNQLETISASNGPAPDIGRIAQALTLLIESIIMGQESDLSRQMSLVSKGVTLLQDQIRELKLGSSLPEEAAESFLGELRDLGLAVEAAPLSDVTPQDGPQEDEEREAEPNESTSGESPAGETSVERNLIVDKETCYEFINETLSSLAEVEPLVVELESDPSNKELINAIFRCFHTAKGVSGFLNLQRMNRYTHESENLLDEIRNDRISYDERVADFILDGFDFIRQMLEAIRANLDRDILYEPEYEVQSRIDQVRNLLDASQEEPTEQGEKEPIGQILVSMEAVTPSEVDLALEEQKTGSPGKKIGEILTDSGKVSTQDVDEALKRQKTVETTIRVATDKLDHIVDMVGELVIAQSLVSENPVIRGLNDQKLFKDFSQLNRITTELQKTAMSMRMVPIRQTFQKMVRLVRDLSKKSGKQVNLTMTGEETEIDRNMVDDIYDPLVHMVRNALDHGLETPEERRRSGKPASGTLKLRAYHQGGHLYIEIGEDGRGLNRDKIFSKAVEKGLVSKSGNYTDHEVHNFIFLPGFSTADKITDISGRGVGMDVVKKFVEKLRGSVEIKSQAGVGSTFTIKLPLTLAIIDGILVRVGKERYIIPAPSVKESLQPEGNQYVKVSDRGEAINIRGKIHSLIRLHEIFGINSENTKVDEAILVVVEHEGKEACLMIDEVLGKQEVVIKSLGRRLKDVQGFSGGTILGDGRVGLILDIKSVMEVFGA